METTYNQVASLILKVMRTENGFRIEDVATGTSINAATISKYENAPNSITFEILNKLVVYYGSSLTIFFEKCNAKMQSMITEIK